MKTKPPFVRSPYNYDTEEASDQVAYIPVGDSMTVQSMTDDADINVLMRRYGITGKFPENPRAPMYGDFTGINDYQSALNAIRRAEQGFMEFPADFRARFQNDPQQLLEFMENPANLEEGRKLGLLKPAPAAPEPPGAAIATPPATTGTPPPNGGPRA